MEAWLTSGVLGEVEVTKVVSDEQRDPVPPGQDLPPLVQDFIDAFMRLVKPPGSNGFKRRPGSRLYLYFSGHGFCEKQVRTAHAALYVANADRFIAWHIYGTFYAQWAKDHGLFDEIVLIMDCCRDAELTKKASEPPFPRATDLSLGRDVRLFELYAAPRGGKALERPIPSRGNEVHGLVTHAFLEAIEHADPGSGSVRTAAVKAYIENQWKNICAGTPADPPEIVIPPNGEIAFARAVRPIRQRIGLARVAVGDRITVTDAADADVATCTIEAGQVNVRWADGRIETVPLADGAYELPLLSGFYRLISGRADGSVLRMSFQAGDPNVAL